MDLDGGAPRGRDLAGSGRFPPVPRYPPLAFYSSIRLADPEQLTRIMSVDPYYITQDNGAGAPVHFAATYRQLDMLHHLLINGAEVNQRDPRGLTPLHRVAHLAHLDGYMEIYEYLLSMGADPSIMTDDYDPYLSPGPKLPADMTTSPEVVEALKALEQRYAAVPKVREPHPFIGDWWTLYDYGLDAVKKWEVGNEPRFPEVRRREKQRREAKERRAELRAQKKAFLDALAEGGPEAARALVRVKLSAADQKGGITAGEQTAEPEGPFTAFLFPGQGSQVVGMLRESMDLPEVKAMLATAQQVLGYDLLDRCLTGPQPVLDDTQVAQPALLVAGCAAAVRAGTLHPAVPAAARAAAGLSLGEYAALVWAGALSLEDGLKVVRVRAEAMSAAASQGEPHGMLSIVGLDDETLQSLCTKVLQEVQVAGGTVCQVANYLFPQGRVVSGHKEALQRLSEMAMARGALKASMLAVSGAFHTRLMDPARKALAQALSKVQIQSPRVPVYSNVTAEPFPSDPDAIRALLARQLVEPVQWEATLTKLIAAGKAGGAEGGCARLFELGPGAQLKAMVRRLDQPTWKTFTNVTA